MALALSLAALGWLCGGCSGINRSIDISPATFLLPGLIQVEPVEAPLPDSLIAQELVQTVALAK